ncbi:phosphopantetheine-binding protein [Nocardia sp. NPDC058176]|uniref:phosphopantetheine-binding protein n=1 Tax=Nocardia sp. NPDC058176 TaxID=3346368 RepID=UPI0036D794CA
MTSDQDEVGSIEIDEICTILHTAVTKRHSDTVIEVEPDTELLITGLIDSLTLVNVVAELERRTKTKLPESFVIARNFRTPSTLHAAVLDACGSAAR